MVFVKFGDTSIKLLYPFLMGISFFFIFIFLHFLSFHPFISACSKCVIESTAIVLFLIQKSFNKNIKINSEISVITTFPTMDLISDSHQKSNSIEYLPGNNKKQLFFFLLGISLLNSINSILFFYLRGIGNMDYISFFK